LAYSVSPIKSEGIEAGYFGAYIGCSPEKADKALQMMRAEFQKLKDSLVSVAELERAKRYTIGRHDIDLQRTSAISSAVIYNDIYGLDLNEPFKAAEKYGPITAEQIRQVAQDIFSQPEVVSLVSPAA
jgi:zinc protease